MSANPAGPVLGYIGSSVSACRASSMRSNPANPAVHIVSPILSPNACPMRSNASASTVHNTVPGKIGR